MDDRRPLIERGVPLALLLTAAVLLFVRLSDPARIIFDEIYYVNDARSYLVLGVEDSFAVHPTVGKWVIALGMQLFGDNPFGWRAGTALFGVITVGSIYWMARRLFDAVAPAALAASLLMLDGLFFVQSRTSMLDAVLMGFTALAAALMVEDHIRTKRRDQAAIAERDAVVATLLDVADDEAADETADETADRTSPPEVPPARLVGLLRRPFLLGSGLVWGLALGTKWSAAAGLGAAGLLLLGWEVQRRRAAGQPEGVALAAIAAGVGTIALALGDLLTGMVAGAVALAVIAVVQAARKQSSGAIPGTMLIAALSLVTVPFLVYALTWLPWVVNYENSGEYQKDCPETTLEDGSACTVGLGGRVSGIVRYHEAMAGFHRGLSAEHSYRAPAYTWPVIGRPVVYYYETCTQDDFDRGYKVDDDGNPGEDCLAPPDEAGEVIGMGSPLVWWGFLLGLPMLAWLAFERKLGAGTILTFWGGQLGPWVVMAFTDQRPMFFFYNAPIVPFIALGLAAAVWGVRGHGRSITGVATSGAGAMIGAVVGAMAGDTRPTILAAAAFGAVAAFFAGFLVTVPDALDDETAPAPAWRRPHVLATGAVLLAAIVTFVYFYPVWAGVVLPREQVSDRWWLTSWI